ncbi:hypothetical protein ACLK15_07525 [Escherichia coli]
MRNRGHYKLTRRGFGDRTVGGIRQLRQFINIIEHVGEVVEVINRSKTWLCVLRSSVPGAQGG